MCQFYLKVWVFKPVEIHFWYRHKMTLWKLRLSNRIDTLLWELSIKGMLKSRNLCLADKSSKYFSSSLEITDKWPWLKRMRLAPTVDPLVWSASMALMTPQRTQLCVLGFSSKRCLIFTATSCLSREFCGPKRRQTNLKKNFVKVCLHFS